MLPFARTNPNAASPRNRHSQVKASCKAKAAARVAAKKASLRVSIAKRTKGDKRSHRRILEQLYNDAIIKGSNYHLSDELDMRNVILLDSQSTMDLFCQRRFVGKDIRIRHYPHSAGQRGYAQIQARRRGEGFQQRVLVQRESCHQHFVPEERGEEIPRHIQQQRRPCSLFTGKEHGLDDMHFRMHKSGLHVYYPKKGQGIHLR